MLSNNYSEKNKLKDMKDESNGPTDDAAKETKPAAKTADKKPAAAAGTTTPTKSATAVNAESTTAKKTTPKVAVTKANRPGPASKKRQVLVSLKRTSAAAIKAATNSTADSKWARSVHHLYTQTDTHG